MNETLNPPQKQPQKKRINKINTYKIALSNYLIKKKSFKPHIKKKSKKLKKMTEKYWQRYKQQLSADPFYSETNEIWKRTRADMKRREKPKHHLELYSFCKTENPFIRQIKNSPNITVDSVAELICREKACELQYCLSLQRVAASNWRSGIKFFLIFL